MLVCLPYVNKKHNLDLFDMKNCKLFIIFVSRRGATKGKQGIFGEISCKI